MRHFVCFGLMTLLAVRAGGAGPDAKELKEVRDRAIAYLTKSQSADGSWSSKLAGPGVTAITVAALVRNGVSPSDPVVAKALGFIEKSIQKNGGIYDKGYATYVTSVALMALAEVNRDGKYDTVVKNATAFLRKMQYGEDTTKPDDIKFGGAGYEEGSRPDMSNTQYFIDALVAAGISKDDPAIKNALKFVSRCQNIKNKEFNDQPFAQNVSEADEGGLVYAPFVRDKDPRVTPKGGLRSAGAMTYAGLKTFLYAGVKKDDPRVVGALNYLKKHYTLDENPGMGTAGLYYYYHTFAKAMTALGEDEFEAGGKKHDWRKDLFDALKKRQQEDGSYVNKGERTFAEFDPNLATSFALLSMSYLKK
jgi:squalene-hopene/tetraprenyl-beta-curcumene cyclase